jgi:hypothetical protein
MNPSAREPKRPRLRLEGVLLLLVAVVVVAAFLVPRMLRKPSEHIATVFNDSDAPLMQLRLTVAGQTFTTDSLAAHTSQRWPFRTRDDSKFSMSWQRPHDPDARTWSGGRVSRGPLVQRHELHVRPDDGVIALVRRAP